MGTTLNNMGFIEKAKQIVTGKTLIERKREAAAMTEIRKKATTAQLQERQKQAIKFAQEKEKVQYERKIKQLKQPQVNQFSMMNYGSPFGQSREPRLQSQVRTIKSAPRTKSQYVKIRGKHVKIRRKPVRRKIRYSQTKPQPTQKYNILGSAFGGNRKGNGRYDVLGGI